MSLTRSRNEILAGPTPVWKMEIETGFQEALWQDAPTFRYKFRLGTKKDCARSQEPLSQEERPISVTSGVAAG
jgi:hypothetical protein